MRDEKNALQCEFFLWRRVGWEKERKGEVGGVEGVIDANKKLTFAKVGLENGSYCVRV